MAAQLLELLDQRDGLVIDRPLLEQGDAIQAKAPAPYDGYARLDVPVEVVATDA
jgi:hypothetical protein